MLEVAESRAAYAAAEAAKFDERDKALTQHRVDAQARATEAAQRRQQAEHGARCGAPQLEATALAARSPRASRSTQPAERQKQLADSAQRKHLRNERYGLVLARAWHAARGTTGVFLIIAIALVIGANALMTESQPPIELTATASQPIKRAPVLFFKTDKDLDAFALRVQQTPAPRDKSPQ